MILFDFSWHVPLLIVVTAHFPLFHFLLLFLLHVVLLFSDDWSSISSNTSSLVAGDGLDVFTPNKPHTSNPSLHVHTLGDLDTQGHHRRGSSGDKIKIQISPEFRNELADRHANSKVQQGLLIITIQYFESFKLHEYFVAIWKKKPWTIHVFA